MNAVYIIAGIVLSSAFFYWREKRKPRDTRYHVRVKFAHGTSVKLVLNKEQFEQLEQWINHPDGVYDIKDEKSSVFLERKHVASVEMRKK